MGMQGPSFPYSMFRFPYTLDNTQDIMTSWFPATNTTINFAGKWPVEERILTDVASYGKQLGWLSEIVLALAKKKAPPAETVEKLADAVTRIDRIKDDLSRSAEDELRSAIERLKNSDPRKLRRLLADYADKK